MTAPSTRCSPRPDARSQRPRTCAQLLDPSADRSAVAEVMREREHTGDTADAREHVANAVETIAVKES